MRISRSHIAFGEARLPSPAAQKTNGCQEFNFVWQKVLCYFETDLYATSINRAKLPRVAHLQKPHHNIIYY